MENSEDTQAARRLRVENATFSWTPRAWCLQCESIAQRSRPGKVLSSCWNSREIASPAPPPLLWMDAGYSGEGKGADWVEKALGWTAQIVRHPPKLAPDEVMRVWVRGWAKEG